MESHSQNREDRDLIAFVRHGAYNPWTGSLTEGGQKQIHAAASRLRESSIWTRIISSPATRAKESADILSQILGIPVQTEERWGDKRFLDECRASLRGGTMYVTHFPILRRLIPEWEPEVGEVKIIDQK